jgi:hypothetical protein
MPGNPPAPATTPERVVVPDGTVVEILTGQMEHHIGADVAYAVWQYWRATGDDDFFLQAGAEILEDVTGFVLHAVFHSLFEQGVALEEMLLKPNMVISGKACTHQASVQEVATATLRCLRRHVPGPVPGIVFLSGGQNAHQATLHLNAINRLAGPKPWKISFSYGRALQDPALDAWHGQDENLQQQALYRRARSNGAASVEKYTDEMEEAPPTDEPPHRRDWRDD